MIGSENSGWSAFAYAKYLEKNAFRPVIIQVLSEKVDPYKVEKFIKRSQGVDDDYLTSGVCSSLCASAINAGVTFGFDCKGIDTPKKVYDLARKKGHRHRGASSLERRRQDPRARMVGCGFEAGGGIPARVWQDEAGTCFRSIKSSRLA
ncbi:MAG: hypothetical protein ACRELZ_10350 [Candidatus Rokuibacteriota bacterium]